MTLTMFFMNDSLCSNYARRFFSDLPKILCQNGEDCMTSAFPDCRQSTNKALPCQAMSTQNLSQNTSRSPPSALEILQNQSLTMLVQQEIERMIVGGELGAGAKLSENTIAVRLGVS